MDRRRQLDLAVLPRAEALPFILEDVAARPALFEVRQGQRTLGWFNGWQSCNPTEAAPERNLDDFLAAHVVEINRPIIDPMRPMLCELLFRYDPVLALAD